MKNEYHLNKLLEKYPWLSLGMAAGYFDMQFWLESFGCLAQDMILDKYKENQRKEDKGSIDSGLTLALVDGCDKVDVLEEMLRLEQDDRIKARISKRVLEI